MSELGNGPRAIVHTAVLLGTLVAVVACGAVPKSDAASQPSPAAQQPTATSSAPGESVTVPTEHVELAIQKATLRG
ncbi:MAG: hypothetical protein ACK42I_11035, partial [Thermomicrobium sp.]